MNLTLKEWDYLVGRHLHLIEAGAEMCERHATQLLGTPEWETRAMERVEEAERALVGALVRLNRARDLMKEKPRVS
jgi:hypothetical protein